MIGYLKFWLAHQLVDMALGVGLVLVVLLAFGGLALRDELRRRRGQRQARTAATDATAPLLEPLTHDYTDRRWGHDYTFEPRDGGFGGSMSGWGRGLHFADYLILRRPGGTTRYQIQRIWYQADPPDQWFADVVFAPRAPTPPPPPPNLETREGAAPGDG